MLFQLVLVSAEMTQEPLRKSLDFYGEFFCLTGPPSVIRLLAQATRLAPTRVPLVPELEKSAPRGSSSRGSRGPRNRFVEWPPRIRSGVPADGRCKVFSQADTDGRRSAVGVSVVDDASATTDSAGFC